MHDSDTCMIDTASTRSNMYFSISFSDIKGIHCQIHVPMVSILLLEYSKL